MITHTYEKREKQCWPEKMNIKKVFIGLLIWSASAASFAQTQCGTDLDGSGDIDTNYELVSCNNFVDGPLCPINQGSCYGSYSNGFTCPYGNDNECIDINPNHPPHQSCSINRTYTTSHMTPIDPIKVISRSSGTTSSCGSGCWDYILDGTYNFSDGVCHSGSDSQTFSVVNKANVYTARLTTQAHSATGQVKINGGLVYQTPTYPECSNSYGTLNTNVNVLGMIGSDGSTFTHTSTYNADAFGRTYSTLRVTGKYECEEPREKITNSCGALESNAGCYIRNEWVDDVQTIRNFRPTGNTPVSSTKQFGTTACGLTSYTHNDWVTKRDYVCPPLGYTPDMDCSAESCVDPTKIDITHVEEVPDEPPANDGGFDSSGTCLGEIQIFSGKPARCRKRGVQTSWQNCCKANDDVMSDTMGGSGEENSDQGSYVSSIGIAAKMGVDLGSDKANDFLKTVFDPATMAFDAAEQMFNEFFVDTCDEKDLETAFMANSGYCVFLGEVCREKWEFVGCVQKQKTYCCFNSRLSAIIQREGRKQLTTLTSFGSASRPNCRGFTPEEFQAIDFSRIDMSEYYDEIQHSTQQQMGATLQGAPANYAR